MKKYIFSVLALSLINTCAYARLYPVYGTSLDIQSAKETRAVMRNIVYFKHEEAINWWLITINDRIVKESGNLSASFCIDVTVASFEVQQYLVDAYTANGYRVELIPGWNKAENLPDGKTWLGLSW